MRLPLCLTVDPMARPELLSVGGLIWVPHSPTRVLGQRHIATTS